MELTSGKFSVYFCCCQIVVGFDSTVVRLLLVSILFTSTVVRLLLVGSLLTSGDILELGAGVYSTPLLHNITQVTNPG